MEVHVFKLHFSSPLHLSKGVAEYTSTDTILHADTLKSAMASTLLQLYGADWQVEKFMDAFRVSSAFPFYQDLLLFPVPSFKLPFMVLANGQNPEEEDIRANKLLKKLKFLSFSLFEKAINIGNTGSSEIAVKPDVNFAGGGKYLVDISERDLLIRQGVNKANLDKEDIYKTELQWRVNKGNYIGTSPTTGAKVAETPEENSNGQPMPYVVERIYFRQDAGLYCMVQTEDAAVMSQIRTALALLGDSGIGTDRTVGNGFFRVSEEVKSLTVPQSQAFLALSLFCPLPEDMTNMNLRQSSYNLVKRGGWITHTSKDTFDLRKRSVYMFTEGSIFSACTRMPTGKLVDVRPADAALVDHPVWRDGRALFIPVNYQFSQSSTEV